MGTPTITASLRYADGPGAIEFLCRAFGFAKQLVVPAADGTIAHAQLTLGNGMVMLSSTASEFAKLVKPPRETGGVGSVCLCVVIGEVDAHCARARAAGAEILQEPADKGYGGRDYVCRDGEGYVWCFGSYDPWK